jgi:hypothetical protein
MIYQLVLITNLGVITPLAQFPDRMECIREQAYIQKTEQYSAACLPANDAKHAQAQMEQSMRMMTEMMNKMKANIK